MYDHTCDAPVPADLAAGLEGDAAEPCLLDRGHNRWTAHTNAYVTWPSKPEATVSRVELILALADNLTAEDVDLIRPFLRLAELAQPTAPDGGARKPGFDTRPMIGANSQPCVRPADHEGDHRNIMGRVWPRTTDAVQAPDNRAEELTALQAQASTLWDRLLGGEDSTTLRARIGRLESLQAALMAGDASLVASCHCGGRTAVASV